MDNVKKNISWVVDNDLCVGCGVCQDACPKSAISVESDGSVFRPVVNAKLCINDRGCHRCRTVCPGAEVKLTTLSEKVFNGQERMKEDPYIGKHIAYYSGYSNDYEIRHEGASGGMTSQFLIYLLEKGYIQGAVVTRFHQEKAFWVDTFVAKTKEEILTAKSSKYCPVTMAGVVRQIKKMDGKYAIVGLPCHLHGLRKMAEIDKAFSEKVFAFVGLYCSCGRRFDLTRYVFESRGVSLDDVRFFTYRRGAGMGKMYAKVTKSAAGKNGYQDCCNNSETQPRIKERIYEDGFQNYYLALRSFFNIHRCMHCIDHFAELADISFGDLHTGKYIEDKVGISSIVSRTQTMDDILHEMADKNIITLDSLSKEDLLSSQKYVKTKKHVNPAYMKIDGMFGRKTPQYDMPLAAIPIHKALKSYLVKTSQMFVGKHKYLYWIIRLMSKDMKNWK